MSRQNPREGARSRFPLKTLPFTGTLAPRGESCVVKKGSVLKLEGTWRSPIILLLFNLLFILKKMEAGTQVTFCK